MYIPILSVSPIAFRLINSMTNLIYMFCFVFVSSK